MSYGGLAAHSAMLLEIPPQFVSQSSHGGSSGLKNSGRPEVRDEQGQAIGMASAQLVISTAEGAPAVWIEDVIVHPAFRRQGLGRLLLEHLLEWAKARGATRAQLLADNYNLSAELFYNALGWQTTQLGVRRRFIE